MLPHHRRTSRSSWQRKVVQLVPADERLRPARSTGCRRPTTSSSRRTRPSRSSCRCGSARATSSPKPQRRAGSTASTVHFEDGTSDDFDVDRLRDGLQHHLPVLRPGLHQRAGQPAPALQADVQARHRRPALRRVRPVDADAVPVRRVPGPAARGATPSGAYALPDVAEMERGDQGGRGRSTSATCSDRRGTPSRSTTSSTSTTSAPARSRQGAAGPARRLRAMSARRATPGTGWSTAADRTAATHRRDALLESLRPAPAESSRSTTINVAEISRRAGVTRSAFYFYFENKALAVAALMQELYDEAARGQRAAGQGRGRPGRADPSRDHGALRRRRQQPAHLSRAMLEARAPARPSAQMWDAGPRRLRRASIAEMIETERAAGRAPDGPDADARRHGAARPQRPRARAALARRPARSTRRAHRRARVRSGCARSTDGDGDRRAR